MSRKNKVLIVKISSLGDIVHALLSCSILKRYGFEVHWIAKRQYFTLFYKNKNVDFLYNFSARSVYKLKGMNFDYVIDIQGLIKTAFASFVISKNKAFGFSDDNLREKLAGYFYRKQIDVGKDHIVKMMRSFICSALSVEDDGVYDLGLDLSCFNSVNINGNYIILFPSAAWETKRLDGSWCRRFLSLANSKGLDVIVVCGKEDFLRLRDWIPVGRLLAFLDIGEVISVIKRARCVVGPDTGFVHLAAALGVPCVSLFSPTDHRRNSPFGPKVKVIKGDCPGYGCFRRVCVKRCTSSIPVDRAFEEVLTFLS